MIVFETNGEIDVAAITTFGVSVKVGDNPIGMFGTGLKYGVAVLLRTGHRVTGFIGEEPIEFSTRRQLIRGRAFEVVELRRGDGQPESAGFTTDLGKTWQVWMAYRELYCNARDAHAPQLLVER